MDLASTSAGLYTLSISKVSSVPIEVPSPREQKEIVRRVEELFAFADSLDRKYQEAVKRVGKLTPSVLAKAFRGELVRQDPNDEPASVLLERIKGMSKKPTERKGRIITRIASDTIEVTDRAQSTLVGRSQMTKNRSDEDVRGQPYLAGILRGLGGSADVTAVFQLAALSVADFYKQLSWEVDQKLILDKRTTLVAA
jgi:type I restriction enzyme S subunit